MGREIGNFIDPVTGERHWLETNTIKKIKLSPSSVTTLSSEGEGRKNSLIEFKLDNIDVLQVATLVAEYNHKDKTYRSEEIHLDELEFAQNLYDSICRDEMLDNTDYMVKAKEYAMNDLKAKMLFEGIILGQVELNGAGYIYSGGKKAMTIDKIKISPQERIPACVDITNCVGPISLNDLEKSSISFYSMGLEFCIADYTINESTEGRVRSYELSTERVIIQENENGENFKSFDLGEEPSDQMLEEFIANRRDKLDNLYEDAEDALDDRLADIF